MTKIAVPDMMCENCVKRITNALTEADLKFSVSLEEKTVTIDGCENCVKTAVSELEDLRIYPGDSVKMYICCRNGRYRRGLWAPACFSTILPYTMLLPAPR